MAYEDLGLIELGFIPGATLYLNGSAVPRYPGYIRIRNSIK